MFSSHPPTNQTSIRRTAPRVCDVGLSRARRRGRDGGCTRPSPVESRDAVRSDKTLLRRAAGDKRRERRWPAVQTSQAHAPGGKTSKEPDWEDDVWDGQSSPVSHIHVLLSVVAMVSRRRYGVGGKDYQSIPDTLLFNSSGAPEVLTRVSCLFRCVSLGHS